MYCWSTRVAKSFSLAISICSLGKYLITGNPQIFNRIHFINPENCLICKENGKSALFNKECQDQGVVLY
jgi:hypothetical protein